MTEGQLFTGIIKWCGANTKTEQEAIQKFQHDFANKIIAENISESEFMETFQPLVKFIPDPLFKQWPFEIIQNKCKQATRFALNPYKVIQTEIQKDDFLTPVPGTLFIGSDEGPDYDLWSTTDEFADVNVDVKIYQKITQGLHPGVPQGKFGIMLETLHTCKDGANMSCITERVSVKMIARKANGSVVKKLFRPLEDSVRRESAVSRKNIFVLSKNKDERLEWTVMEVVVIIDRRPKCYMKAISGEKFATTVCSGPTRNYLDQAQSFR